MSGPHQLPELPFSPDALYPLISPETFEYHHGKHHAGYVKKLNGMIEGTEFAAASLEDIVRKATGGLFDNAAQHFNHGFYWNCLAPPSDAKPEGGLARAIDAAFGSFDGFRKEFLDRSATLFGSGWCWLVRGADGALKVVQTSNAGCPVRDGDTPILVCDVWEHAYYIDYRNDRGGYLESFWKLANWKFAESRFEAAAS